ncbi:molybdopterin cofactor-binding domain-containing protein [Magnetospira sp. QH-2]|uniref:molybdopterin-dependent oxidoreductase n=1 Tax=Magnetospira sp. (strain QH-2) TaxID=1288970 RepID=UPI0003E80CA4|nr:molybdopterin cofactor-binding domain-containing protein [Magnetospira sp. QH-2]CCQ75121.1 putative xanthine dehydrogenase [Magnetospira sp. QH-2]
MAEILVELTVNGRKIKRLAKAHWRLIDFLRDELHLTGTKEGCGAGECGTCSVFVDGSLMKACLLPVAKAQGVKVQTVEGLAGPGDLTPVQKAFYKTGASQCGYCIPGMVMAATATLRANPHADQAEIKERMGGNICRCTGYQKIVEAVELARDVMNGALPASALDAEDHGDSFIGSNVRRIDAPGKVSGALKYAGDMVMPNMLHVQVLRSPRAHAKIVTLDTRAAEALDGVEAVITSADVPGVDGFGVFVHDQPIMARDKVRYVGEAVAAVAAEDLETAKQALRLIDVTYEDLPAVFHAEEALKPGAPVLHDRAPDNLVKHIPICKGDPEKGFAEADVVVENTYETQAVEHAYLEPEAGLAYVDADGVVTIQSPSQNITHHRHMLSDILDLPINKIRMIMSPVGGGFGGKEDMIYQGMLALLAMKTGRPVRLVFTREESIISTSKRHPARISYKMGLKNNGRIVASQIKSVCDGGAYGMSTEGVMRKMAILGPGPYDIPNVRIDTYGAYTNNTPSGAFRTFGAMQSQFATETHLDICAAKLGLDPFEIRRINALKGGDTTHTQQPLESTSAARVLEAAHDGSGWEDGAPVSRGETRGDLGRSDLRAPCTLGARLVSRAGSDRGKARGRGMAASWYGIARTAAMDRAGAWVELDDGGTAKVVTGVTEIGEGILTVLAQVAAEELGIHPEDITLGDNDTARSPEAAHAGATRQTYMIANAVAMACRDARDKFDREMAAHWDVEPSQIEAANGQIWARETNLRMTMAEAVHVCKAQRGFVPVGSGNYTAHHTGLDPVNGSGKPWQAYVFGCQVAEVEVDRVTGEVQVLGIWAAHDVGRAVNPRGVEGQIEGAVVQGLGQALMEDYKLNEGHSSTDSFAKYILPTSLDVPRINSIIIEDPDPLSPLGAKGIGEPALVPTAPAILNAIYDAVGVRITSMPATPEKILAALHQKNHDSNRRDAAE